MEIILYRCGCGCICLPEETIVARRNEAGKEINRIRCKEHKDLDIGEVVGKIKICQKCNKSFEIKMLSGRTVLCLKCRNKATKQRVKRQNKRAKKRRKDAILTKTMVEKRNAGDPNRWMCKHWDSECFDYAMKHNLPTRPCKNCPDFEAEAQQHDPLFSRYSEKTTRPKTIRKR